MKPHVHVVSTGGTIAAKTASSTQTVGYSAAAGDRTEGIGLLADDLIRSVPGIENHADISAENIYTIPSSAMTSQSLLKLAKRINQILRDDSVDGVVVTHGTDTLEETAFFLHMVVKSEKPVVVVGSMLPATVLSADGPLNLYSAILTAADPQSRGKGVIVCMCSRLFCARDVSKTSTFRTDAFKTLEYGALGHVVGDMVRYYYAPVRPHTRDTEFDIDAVEELPRVEIVYTYQGCDESLLAAAVNSGCSGIVCAGLGSGAIPPAMREYYRQLEKKPPLVRGSRICSGYVAAHGATPDDVYDTIPAGDFTVNKARLLLQLALLKTTDKEQLREIFKRY